MMPTSSDLAEPAAAPARRPLRLFTFAAPSRLYPLLGRLLPWLWGAALALGAAGLGLGLLAAPADAVQGEVYRIIYLHVPAAWVSMVLYLAMAFWAAIGWAFNARGASMLAQAIAPTGALFTFIALWTGALWGRPTWGAYWVWDARLTSYLILLLLYLGFMALVSAIDDVRRADRAAALLAVVGAVNVPIIYFSVKWWNTLHQGMSVSPGGGSSMHPTMLRAMLLSALGCWAYAFAAVFQRTRALIVEREASSAWVAAMVGRPRNA